MIVLLLSLAMGSRRGMHCLSQLEPVALSGVADDAGRQADLGSTTARPPPAVCLVCWMDGRGSCGGFDVCPY